MKWMKWMEWMGRVWSDGSVTMLRYTSGVHLDPRWSFPQTGFNRRYETCPNIKLRYWLCSSCVWNSGEPGPIGPIEWMLLLRGQNVFLAASFNGWKDQIPMVRSGCLGRFKAFNCSGFCWAQGTRISHFFSLCSAACWLCRWVHITCPKMFKDVPSCYFVKARIFGCAGASKRPMKGWIEGCMAKLEWISRSLLFLTLTATWQVSISTNSSWMINGDFRLTNPDS